MILTEFVKMKYTYFIGLINLLFIIMISLFVVNYSKSKSIQQRKFYSSIPSLEARKDFFARNHPEAKIILNKRKGIWDKSGNKEKIIAKRCVELQYDDEDTNKIFYKFSDLKLDKNENIYVSLFESIKKFSATNQFILSIGRRGNGPGEFLGPLEMCLKKDTLFVLDWGTNRISLFDTSGIYLKSFRIEKTNTAFTLSLIYDASSHTFFASFYDRKMDNIIHCFDESGKHLYSFGETIHTKGDLSYLDYMLKKDNSNGRLFEWNNRIFYSQRNPYEIRLYSLDGTLEKIIFRENDFMPNESIEIVNKDTFIKHMPSNSTFICVWNDMILNCVAVGARVQKNIGIGTVIDFYSLSGQLLTSLYFKNRVAFQACTKEGKLYGIEIIPDTGEAIIVSYTLQLNF